jgi:plasmid stabilization system protein ParE
MALAKITGVPLDQIRGLAGRIDRLAETPGAYIVDDSDVVAQIRSALGPDYALLIALPTDERQQIILSVAAILHHQLALRQRIRELPYLPTA